MPSDAEVKAAADALRLLADPTRVKMLWALLQGELPVTRLAELVGAAPTAVSQHLAKLRLAGLVESHRQGTYVYYSASDPRVRAILTEAFARAHHGGAAGPAPRG